MSDSIPAPSGTRWPATVFSVAAILEGASWAGLLIGMYLKYVTETTELGVTLFGPIHGLIFVGYVVATAIAAQAFAWGWKISLLAMAAAIPPLVTIPLEIWLRRRGMLLNRRRSARRGEQLT